MFSSSAFSQMQEGSIAFTGFNADGSDGFSFILLRAVAANTSIFFTDNEWVGSTINSGEGILEWNSIADLSAGTVITITGSTIASTGTISAVSGSFNLGASNETLLAYTGTSTTPDNFLAAISNDNFGVSGVSSLSGTGLIEGISAINLDSDEDVGVLDNGVDCTGIELLDCATLINDSNNWSTEDGGFDQSNNSVYPDFPDDIEPQSGFTIPGTYGTLPVTYTYFKATRKSKNILLQWQTATEINNDRFEIQRSSNGVSYRAIGEEKGKGNSYMFIDYSYTDYVPSAGINYYRLKQIDIDGRYDYSDVMVVAGNRAKISITPSTTRGNFNVTTEGAANITVLSTTGQIVSSMYNIDGNFIFDLFNQANGLYFLRIEMNNGEIYTEKVVKY